MNAEMDLKLFLWHTIIKLKRLEWKVAITEIIFISETEKSLNDRARKWVCASVVSK